MSNIRTIPQSEAQSLVNWWEPFSRTTFPSLWERPEPITVEIVDEGRQRMAWSYSDVERLKAYWPVRSAEAIADALERTPGAVRNKAATLHLRKRRAA